NSRTAPSWAETVGKGDGLIQERSIFQVKAILPSLRARSTASQGSATLASTKFNCTISWRTDSGQLSASAVRPTINGVESVAGLAEGGLAGIGMRAGMAREGGIRAGTKGGVASGGRNAGAAVMVLRTGAMGTGGGGVALSWAGPGADSAPTGPTEKMNPWPRGSKGLLISRGTSTCF